MHSKKQDKNTVRHIGIHKNEELLESELPQIPIDGSFQIVKEQKTGSDPIFLNFFRLNRAEWKRGLTPFLWWS